MLSLRISLGELLWCRGCCLRLLLLLLERESGARRAQQGQQVLQFITMLWGPDHPVIRRAAILPPWFWRDPLGWGGDGGGVRVGEPSDPSPLQATELMGRIYESRPPPLCPCIVQAGCPSPQEWLLKEWLLMRPTPAARAPEVACRLPGAD